MLFYENKNRESTLCNVKTKTCGIHAFALWFLRQQRQQVQRSDSELCLNFLYVFTDSFEVLFELSGFTYFLRHIIDAIKFSTLSILTMPASSPLSASFIAESVVSFGKVIVYLQIFTYLIITMSRGAHCFAPLRQFPLAKIRLFI